MGVLSMVGLCEIVFNGMLVFKIFLVIVFLLCNFVINFEIVIGYCWDMIVVWIVYYVVVIVNLLVI